MRRKRNLVVRAKGANSIDGLRWSYSVGDSVVPSRAGLRVGLRDGVGTVTGIQKTDYTTSGDLRIVLVRRLGFISEGFWHATFWKKATEQRRDRVKVGA